MTEIVETVQVGEPAGEVWESIGRFGAVGAWRPILAKVTAGGEDIGALRRAKSIDGATSIERQIDRSSARRFYRYKVLSTPLPVRDYVGVLRVDDTATAPARWCSRRVSSRRCRTSAASRRSRAF